MGCRLLGYGMNNCAGSIRGNRGFVGSKVKDIGIRNL